MNTTVMIVCLLRFVAFALCTGLLFFIIPFMFCSETKSATTFDFYDRVTVMWCKQFLSITILLFHFIVLCCITLNYLLDRNCAIACQEVISLRDVVDKNIYYFDHNLCGRPPLELVFAKEHLSSSTEVGSFFYYSLLVPSFITTVIDATFGILEKFIHSLPTVIGLPRHVYVDFNKFEDKIPAPRSLLPSHILAFPLCRHLPNPVAKPCCWVIQSSAKQICLDEIRFASADFE